MKNERKNICTICHKNICVDGSDIWCVSCYCDFAVRHGCFGSEAVRLFKKLGGK